MRRHNVTYLILLVVSQNVFSQINYQDNALTLGLSLNTGITTFGGSGVSYVDYNRDGFDDISLATGDNIEPLLYKNLDGTYFVQDNILQNSINYNYKTRSVIWVDYDNDGDRDLFLSSDTNGNRLFKNTNNNLVDVTLSSGLPTENLYTYGASFGDIDNDGCLELYLSNRIGGTSITNYIFKNNCDGTFIDVTESVGLSNAPALTFCSAFFDFNNDGFQDIYVANDKFKPNYLYKNNGDGTFTDVSQSSGTDLIVDAMSITIDDYNADGFFDIFITNTPQTISTMYAPGTILLKNNGNETFTDVTNSSNTSFVSFTWGSNFLDSENDGDLDIYINSQYTFEDSYGSYEFFENSNDGTFINPLSPGFTTNDYKSYGSAIGDFDNNGLFEILSNNDNNQIPSLWVNTAPTVNNYLALTLEGLLSNKDGIGSKIEISINGNKQYRYVLCGEGYISQNSFKEIFGLGTSTIVDYVKIDWLSGVTDILYNVNANQILNVIEGSTNTLSNDIDELNITNLFPNPSSNFVNVQSNYRINKIILFDVLGHLVFSSNYESSDININMEFLSAGVYSAKIFMENGIICTKKIIKE